MSTFKTVKKQLMNNKPINAVQYVRLEHFSEERKNKIVANHGTKRCKDFLDKHPNIKLVEPPYIDSGWSLVDDGDRDELVKMCVRLANKDVNLVLVDNLYELASSPDDAVVAENLLLDWNEAVVLDMQNGILYESIEWLIDYILSGVWMTDDM